MFKNNNERLIYSYDGETVCIESWGKNALRVRATMNADFTENNWALLGKSDSDSEAKVEIYQDTQAKGGAYANMYEGKDNSYGHINNGNIRAEIDSGGVISFYDNNGNQLLKEHFRRLRDDTSMPLNIMGREYKSVGGDSYSITARFIANDSEKIYGMGQYQQHQMNMKGCVLELAQRNSQVTVPFYISNMNYGFLWNNPAIGKAAFANNGTEWTANSSKELDYLVIGGGSPSEIEETYMSITGKPPMMPEYGMGFWQSKLRYCTQDELLAVARKYKELGIGLDVIVADFFHWTCQGEFKFDPKYWPDVPSMCRELEKMGTKLMVSIWPTVDYRSENFREMQEKGFLVKTEKGVRITMLCGGNEVFYDATNPEARKYVWEKIKENYWDKGAKLYWLDVAEPEYTTYEFENYRYHIGSVSETGNIYPLYYLKGFYDGMTAQGDTKPVSLIRSAWAGSARYGGLVWSGDIVSSFECFRRQVKAGLSMAIAGIPWWTTDIGGFHGGNGEDESFRKLFIRWLQYACFCPVMRLHGNRNPQKGFMENTIGSGSDNEIWSFGDEVFEISKKYIFIREGLREYIEEQMEKSHKKGTPVMRPVFYDYPEDEQGWDVEDAYMFGDQLYVAPILYEESMDRQVYLPAGESWIDVWSGTEYQGGQRITAEAPIELIPVFAVKGSKLIEVFK